MKGWMLQFALPAPLEWCSEQCTGARKIAGHAACTQARRCIGTYACNLALETKYTPHHKDIKLIATHTKSTSYYYNIPIIQTEPVSPRGSSPPSIYPARYE